MRMLASALRRHRSNCSLDDLKESLLNTFTGHVAGDGCILRFSADLIDLINVNDALLRALNIKISRLDQTEKNVLDVLTDIARLSQCRSVGDGKGHIQNLGKRLRKQGLAASCRTQQHYVGLGKFNIEILRCLQSLIMIVDRDRKNLFRIVLSDHILIQISLDLFRLFKINSVIRGRLIRKEGVLLGNDLRADLNALITDVNARRSGNQFSDLILSLAAEAAANFACHFSCHLISFFKKDSCTQS